MSQRRLAAPLTNRAGGRNDPSMTGVSLTDLHGGKDSAWLTVGTSAMHDPTPHTRGVGNEYGGSSVLGTWQGFPPGNPRRGREKASTMTTALAPELTATDRCDRCGAQAYIRARLVSGGELLFCAHHGRQHLAALQDKAEAIHDESARLNDGPTVAPVDER